MFISPSGSVRASLQLKALQRSITAEQHDAESTRSCLKSLFTVAKLQLHLYRSQIIEPKPKGRQPSLACALLFAAIVLFVRKIKMPSLRYIHHLTSPARGGGVRRVCGEPGEFFWSSAYSVLKRHQEELHWFSSFWLLLNFCTES